ncbi:hypothetical protein K6119_12050 [Paracrocinitomix mangrovi]|uniref:hypothetical protein n=1 Tax=Paracrocinitomix mangrovi TaxID=2862509 RepID=UPI001C8DB6B4|nr:hypothetical protein [Paracrocinitomix mangrovi]UKN00464.1 hypothetical protein K6119_12050 [Paracrocinitomix mangrovi]
MKRTTLTILSIVMMASLNSCKKKGCTDSTATNFSEEAKKDDGSCTYITDGYTGTASISQGHATTSVANLFPQGTRPAGVGTITSTDGVSWTVPADNNYQDNSFPWASDMHNIYVSGHDYANVAAAEAALDPADVVVIDAAGEVMTAYIWADNYFEMYVNGVPVGKDPVPFTDFNACIVQFKVSPPFDLAMMLVDWEENLGLGSEEHSGNAYHPGDGGLVAVIKNQSGNVISTTDNTWKAQTYYTAPVTDLSCLSESGNLRLSDNCSTADSNDGTLYFAAHWPLPTNWQNEGFDDSNWPAATTYSNTEIGVSNKPSYTNFTDVFDNSGNDAQFIWSTNVILDNLVLVRKTIQ